MKKILFFLCLLFSLDSFSQNIALDIQTIPDTVSYTKARIQFSKAYKIGDSTVVDLYVEQWKELSPTDFISRRRTIVAPFYIIPQVLIYNFLTKEHDVKKTELNLILLPYNIQVK